MPTKNIMLPVDLNVAPAWEQNAINTAVEYAQSFGAELQLLTVIPSYDSSFLKPFFPHGYEEQATAKAMEALNDFIKANVPEGITVHPRVVHGVVYTQILKLAQELGVDLIIMASQRPELPDYLLGSNASKVMRHAACSVMVVRE